MTPRIELKPTKDYGHSYVDKNYVAANNAIMLTQQIIAATFFTILGVYITDPMRVHGSIVIIIGIALGLTVAYQIYRHFKMTTLISTSMSEDE